MRSKSVATTINLLSFASIKTLDKIGRVFFFSITPWTRVKDFNRALLLGYNNRELYLYRGLSYIQLNKHSNAELDLAKTELAEAATLVDSGIDTATAAIATAAGRINTAVALANATNAEFTVTNSTVQADSVILVTMQDENTTNNAQLSCAVHTIAGGSFKISVHHADSAGATSTTASKIHFLVINNSV